MNLIGKGKREEEIFTPVAMATIPGGGGEERDGSTFPPSWNFKQVFLSNYYCEVW